jgi:hypothetical protein
MRIKARDVQVLHSHGWIMVQADIAMWPFAPVEIVIAGEDRIQLLLQGRGHVGRRPAVRLVDPGDGSATTHLVAALRALDPEEDITIRSVSSR